MKKGVRILLITATALAILVAAAALLMPPLAKHYIEKHSKELTGRVLTIDRLRFNAFTGKLRIDGIRMMEADDTTTFAAIGEYYMKMKLWPLLNNRVVIREIRIGQPDLSIYQDGPRFNFDDLLLRFAPGDTPLETPEEPSVPWEVGIDDIAITGGHIFYKDLQIGATWGFEDLDVTVPGIYFKDRTDVGILFNFAQGGSLGLKLNYDMDNADYDLQIDLRELALNGRLPYVQQTLDVGSLNGLFSANLHLNGNLQNLMDLYFDGAIDLAHFSLRDIREEEVVKVDSLHVGLTRGSLRHNQFHFDRLYLLGMAGSFEIYEDGSNNLAALIREQPTPKAGSTPEPQGASSAQNTDSQYSATGNAAEDAKARDSETTETATANTPEETAVVEPLDVRIEDIEIAQGAIHVIDRSHIRPFEYRLSNIRMKSRFDMNKPNRIVVDAQVQKTGRARIRWEGSLSDLGNQNILVNLTNIDLRDFSPYCEHYTAYPLTQGNLSFRSQNIIKDRRLDGANHLDMFEPKVDNKLKNIEPVFNIPLKLGLYVLKDKKGHVKIDLPVQGSLDNPDFSYRKIVMKALGNVLLKVITAPFSFLSGGGGNMEFIDIDPLQREFTSEQYAKFDRLADMLRDKPDMKITLTQRIGYSEALETQARNNLKLEYYNFTQRQADSTTAYRPLNMPEYERVQNLSFKSEAVMDFADSLLRSQGIDPSKLNASRKAMTLYGDRAAGQLQQLMERRNFALMRYMQEMQGIPSAAFCAQTMDSTNLHAYTGKDRYTIGVEVDGETTEVAGDDEAVSTAGEAMGLTSSDAADVAVHATPVMERK